MALRSAAMSMSYSDPPSAPPQQYHLFRQLVILLLLVSASSLWIFILFQEGRLPYDLSIQKVIAGITMAIVAGLGSQLIFSQRIAFFRYITAMTAHAAGVYLLGFISQGKYGISSLEWLPKTIDWDGLSQMGLGFFMILTISSLFRRRTPEIVPEPVEMLVPVREPQISFPVWTSLSSPSTRTSTSTPSRRRRLSPPSMSPSRFLTPGASRQGRTRNERRSGLIRPAKVNPAIAPKRRRRRGQPRVQLALVEEHRCPYCLETVNHSDSRGIVECEVCRTLHHKDCWDITGNCQVPHLNT